jgi:hypothetical protein
MLYLLDTNQDYDEAAAELGVEPAEVGQLITPLTRHSNRGRAQFAIDNGAFSRFDAAGFQSLLKREEPNRDRCLFVVVPDVPMSARRTLEVFHHWYPRVSRWPVALACQNGQEDLDIPWDVISAVFIGGDTAWKTSEYAHAIVRAAKAQGKWTHMGRVNTPWRDDLAREWGIDSVDGTWISRFSHMREEINGYRQQCVLEMA